MCVYTLNRCRNCVHLRIFFEYFEKSGTGTEKKNITTSVHKLCEHEHGMPCHGNGNGENILLEDEFFILILVFFFLYYISAFHL